MYHKPPYRLEPGIFVNDKTGNSVEILAVNVDPDSSGKTVIGIVSKKYISWYYENGMFFSFPTHQDLVLQEVNEKEKKYFEKIKKKNKYLF